LLHVNGALNSIMSMNRLDLQLESHNSKIQLNTATSQRQKPRSYYDYRLSIIIHADHHRRKTSTNSTSVVSTLSNRLGSKRRHSLYN